MKNRNLPPLIAAILHELEKLFARAMKARPLG
jgi:hypothetical protein